MYKKKSKVITGGNQEKEYCTLVSDNVHLCKLLPSKRTTRVTMRGRTVEWVARSIEYQNQHGHTLNIHGSSGQI